jgi:hypothetical protein
MSRSHGTGRPLYFMCWAERRALALLSRRARLARLTPPHDCRRTGRTRNWARGMIGGARVLPYQVEYVCLTCGHRGWSRHTNAGRLALVDPNFESKTEETNA